MSSSSWIKTRDSPKPRGETENATEQKEKESSPTDIQDLRAEFEQLFKAKAWRGIHNLPKERSNRRALVVAINYGERRPPHRLYGTFVDARRIIRMLEEFEYKPGDICVLADIPIPSPTADCESDSNEGDDEESRLPKKVNILKGLKWLASAGGPGKYRFLFFSGHGHFQPSKPSPTSNQCLMPEDVKFRRLQSCSDCVCSENVWRASDQTGEPLLVPEPVSVLWDHSINQRLCASLESGTKFTAVFDCCYSGGMLESKLSPPNQSLLVNVVDLESAAFQNGPGTEIISSAQPNSKGRVAHGVVGSRRATPCVIERESSAPEVQERPEVEDVVMTDPIEQTAQSSEVLNSTQAVLLDSRAGGVSPRQPFIGNFLGLPIEVDLVTGTESRVPQPRHMDLLQANPEKLQQLVYYAPEKPISIIKSPFSDILGIGTRDGTTAPPAEAPQSLLEFTCQRKGIAAAMRPFNDGCKIMCWAACRKLESALEDQRNAGRFTEAFTEFLTRPRIKEETQLSRSTEVLINHLRVKFNHYNDEARKNKWVEQHPKLFISTGLQSEDYLQQEPDI